MNRSVFVSYATRDLVRARVQSQLDATLERSAASRLLVLVLESHRKTWALVGGAPRVWATGVGEPNDLDIVVGGTRGDVDRVVAAWESRVPPGATVERTKLGGYRLRSCDCVLDVWAAPATVAIAADRVQDSKRYRAIAKSAALSLDSLVLTSEGTLYDHGFFRSIQTGTLQLNHSRVERQDKVLTKARRLCEVYGLKPDLALQGLLAQRKENTDIVPLLQLSFDWTADNQ